MELSKRLGQSIIILILQVVYLQILCASSLIVEFVLNKFLDIVFRKYHLLTMNELEDCFKQITQLKQVKVEDVRKIVQSFKPILMPELPSLQFQLPKARLTKDFYDDQVAMPFVPSHELLESYQSSFTKAVEGSNMSKTTNYKLKAHFGKPALQHNYEALGRTSMQSKQQWVAIEQKQENILRDLKELRIEATLPQMEETLLKHELSHLEKKEVKMQNLVSLKDWKKIREKIQAQL